MKKKPLLQLFLIPTLVVAIIISIVPFILIVFSKVKPSIEDNTIQITNNTIENRKLILQNDMVEKWSSIYKEQDNLNNVLEQLIKENDTDINGILKSTDLQQKYLERIFSELVDTLQYNTMSGMFIIMANDSYINNSASYSGFFVRDSDPQNKIESNSDLLMEKGSKQLAQNRKISLDSAWSTYFNFEGKGNREADDFFYKPYEAGIKYSNANIVNLGYWSKPFILEDDYMDNHKMITYSVPLIYNGTVYAVLGSEISVDYINKYFQVKDLDSNLNAGYTLAVAQDDDTYKCIIGKGSLYDAAVSEDDTISFTNEIPEKLYKVKDAYIGNQEIYAVISPLKLYSGNVPYEDTEWVLCGLVTKDYIYGMGEDIYRKLTFSSVTGLVVLVLVVFILVRNVTKPVYRLVDSVRGGVDGIRSFNDSGLLELDELHSVIEKLTDAQELSQKQLLEEKERYQIAVESSQDMFFTYRKDNKTLEIINSGYVDGMWDIKKHPEFILSKRIYPMDRDKLDKAIKNADKEISIDFRIKHKKNDEYIWVNLTANITRDPNNDIQRMVGCVQDINQRKLLEEKQKEQSYYDSVTSFYRFKHGMKILNEESKKYNIQTAAILDIRNLSYITEQYGLLFRDMMVENLSDMIVERCDEKRNEGTIYIRAGLDRILIWMPDINAKQMLNMIRNIHQDFSNMSNEDCIELVLNTGIASVNNNNDIIDISQVIDNAKTALYVAKQSAADIIIYNDLQEDEQNIEPEKPILLEEVEYINRLKNRRISSLALNLFDKNGVLSVVLDVLAIKLKKEYGIKDIIITQFNREYLSNVVIYQWKNKKKPEEQELITYCTEIQYQNFIENKNMKKIHNIDEQDRESKIISEQLLSEDGIIFNMYDNEQYAGSIIYICDIVRNKSEDDDWKELNELSEITKNKISLQRHDLAAQAKSDFLARMSHEIRTPMNGIIGMTDIALMEEQSEEKRIDCLKKIKSSSDYLMGILNDILDMSKIESGKMKLVFEAFSISNMINDISSLMENRIKEKNMELDIDSQLQNDWFVGDELRLKQVIINFLSNAVKYAGENTNIKFSIIEKNITEDNSDIYFAVQDDGVGIPKEKQHLIFQSFEQIDDSVNARRQGAGLGLAICTRIIHMMGSEIELDSDYGKGSTFSFTVNLKRTEEVVATDYKKEVAQKDFTGKRVLLAEDNELNMEIAKTLINKLGIQTEEADNGAKAVECFKEHKEGYYDLILMDVMMPEMDGLEAAKRIRSIDRKDARTIPIYAMSANAFDEDKKRSLDSGMNGHLSKPIDIEKLAKLFALLWADS